MRKPWTEYFFDLARLSAERSTCDRAHVGCVIVDCDNRILATGYNGALANKEHCDDAGHLLVDGHCIRTVHAEANAIADAARRGISLAESNVYVTHSPCINCFKLLLASGIWAIYFEEEYRIGETLFFAERIGFKNFYQFKRSDATQ